MARTPEGLFLPDPEDYEALATTPPSPASAVEPTGDGAIALAAGFASPYFVTDSEAWQADLYDVDLAIFDRPIAHDDVLAPLARAALAGRTVAIVAPELAPSAIATIAVNRLRGVLGAVAIAAPADACAAFAAALPARTARRLVAGRATTLCWR